MLDSNDTANVYFRFNNLNRLQAYTLEREVLNAKFESCGNETQFIGLVLLSNENLDDINDYYVRQRIQIEQCDICISINVLSDSEIFEVPKIVNRMLKYIDCKLSISANSV